MKEVKEETTEKDLMTKVYNDAIQSAFNDMQDNNTPPGEWNDLLGRWVRIYGSIHLLDYKKKSSIEFQDWIELHGIKKSKKHVNAWIYGEDYLTTEQLYNLFQTTQRQKP